MNITTQQIKRIKALTKKLGWDDETYRAVLKHWFDVESCKELSYSGANQCIKMMTAALPPSQTSVNYVSAQEFFDIPSWRQGVWATTSQLWKIWYLWKAVSRQTTDEDRKRAFRVWLKNHFNLSDFKMIQREHVSKIIQALEAMQAQQQK
jgi:aminoglycoside/choline kinase family phosphotransferase